MKSRIGYVCILYYLILSYTVLVLLIRHAIKNTLIWYPTQWHTKSWWNPHFSWWNHFNPIFSSLNPTPPCLVTIVLSHLIPSYPVMTISSCCGLRPGSRGADPLRSHSEALLGSLPAACLAPGTGATRVIQGLEDGVASLGCFNVFLITMVRERERGIYIYVCGAWLYDVFAFFLMNVFFLVCNWWWWRNLWN